MSMHVIQERKKILIIIMMVMSVMTHAQVTSTFNTNAESWTISDINSNSPLTVNYNSTGGNPGGYISASGFSGQPFYWTSPAKFAGARAYFSYGQDLKFDIQINHIGTAHGGYGDVIIVTAYGSLCYDLPTYPAVSPAWSTYTVKLDETTNWHINSPGGPVATKTQVLQYLGAFQSIRINTMYGTANFAGGIDNVILNERTITTPAPAVTSFTPLSGSSGTSVTIVGSGFNAVAANNVVYFAGLKGTITNASANQLVVTVPPGVSAGPVTIVNKSTGLSFQTLTGFVPVFPKGGRLIRDSFKDHVDLTATAPSAATPADIAVGDVDGDGWNDIAMSEVNKTAIDIFRNLGAGGEIKATSFSPNIRFLTGGALTNGAGMALADLDNDGKLDAIHSTSKTPFVGAFVTFRNISTPGNVAFETAEMWDGLSDESPIGAIGDIDGDGLLDMVGAEVGSAGGDFWICQNVSTPGDIQFLYARGFPSNSFRDATLVDLTNDGKPELITNTGSTIDIWINNSTPGRISFSSTVQVPIGADLNVEFADLNADGKQDLIFANFYNGDDVKIRINTNSGGALAASDFATEVILKCDLVYGNRGVTVADINGDGKPEIIVNDTSNSGIFENIYSGGAFNSSAFIEAYPLEAGGGSTYPRVPIVSDLNNDGKNDLVFAITNASVHVKIMENQNTHMPQISLNTISPLKGAIGSSVTITGNYFSTTPSDNIVMFGNVRGTVTSATETELIVTVPAGASMARISVTKNRMTSIYHTPFVPTFAPGVTFNNSHFAPPINFTLTSASYEVAAGDLNLDGLPDIFAEAGGSSYAYRNTHSAGSISASSLSVDDTVYSASSPQLMDLDGDGRMEAVGSVGQFRNKTTNAEINFDPYAYSGAGGTYFNDFADLNNDGKIETIGAVLNTVVINENRTTTGPFKTADPFYTFAAPLSLTKPSNFGSVVAADFDKDGFVDLAATSSNTDNLSVWRNTGSYRLSVSQFTALSNIVIGDNPSRIYTADLDVDGKMDLVIQYNSGTSASSISIFRNQSTTGSISFVNFDLTLPGSITVMHISDLDGDGKPDIIATSEASDQFYILKNTSTPGTINASSFAAPFQMAVNNPRGVTASDLNLDGKPEIIITSAPNSLLVYENLVPNGPSITIDTQPIFTYACEGETATFNIEASGTTNLTFKWQKFDGASFVDIADGSGYTGTSTKTLSINTAITGFNGNGQYRCRVNGDLAAEVITGDAQLTINGLPSPPDVVGGTKCVSPSTVTLTATGTSNGSYRWYDVASGGSVLGMNGSFTTPSIASTKTFYVSIRDSFCESTRVPVDATITLLTKPSVGSNEPIVSGGIDICDGEDCTLTAPTGFVTYTWSNGDTGEAITVDQSGSYTVVVKDSNGCTSPASDLVMVTVNPFPTAIIDVNGTQLSSSPGDGYQWYLNGNVITGETSQTYQFSVLEFGVYAVDVTDNGCTTTSDDFTYLITATENDPNQLKVYPNPFQHELFIESDKAVHITMFDLVGKQLTDTFTGAGNTSRISVDAISSGAYILEIQSGSTKKYLRVQKK